MQIFVCHTYYHIYAALVLSYLGSRSGKQSLLIVSLTRNIYTPEFISRLRNIGWTQVWDLSDQDLVTRISAFDPVHKAILNLFLGRIYPRLNPQVKSIPLQSCQQVFLFNDFHYLSRYVLKKAACPVVLVEDGNNNYSPVRSGPVITALKKLVGIYPHFGRHPKFQTIMVERPQHLPPDIACKGRPLGLQATLENVPSEIKKQITHLFLDFDLDTIPVSAALVLTQPLFDFGRLSIDQHLQVYKAIVNRLQDKGVAVYLKPHPSDTVDYARHLHRVVPLPQTFPVEVLNSMEHIRFRYALGVNTTAVYNITFADHRLSLLAYDENVTDNFPAKLERMKRGVDELDIASSI